MEVPVAFRCTSCAYDNEVLLGTPGFEPKDTEFESLTDAWDHMQTHRGHNLEAFAVLEDR